MVTTIRFGSRAAANDVRDVIDEYLAPNDSRRSKTIHLKNSTPENIVERVEEQAYASQQGDRSAPGMTELTERERRKLRRQYDNWSWQSHGFEAMRVKAALERKGVTEWMDHYVPNEGVGGALENLRASKGAAAARGAGTAVEGARTDEEEMSGKQRRRTQVARERGGQAEQAKPAAFRGDPEAASFLREQRRFEGSIFDIVFNQTDEYGRPVPSGRDAEDLREAHAERTAQQKATDERRQAPVTRDPLEWAMNKNTTDFPGIDTVDPEQLHESRSARAQAHDEDKRAPLADTVAEWAAAPDEYDLPGVDTPTAADGGLPVDDRPQQDTLSFAADATEDRESRLAVEESTGGLLEDTREKPDRGADDDAGGEGRQVSLWGDDPDNASLSDFEL